MTAKRRFTRSCFFYDCKVFLRYVCNRRFTCVDCFYNCCKLRVIRSFIRVRKGGIFRRTVRINIHLLYDRAVDRRLQEVEFVIGIDERCVFRIVHEFVHFQFEPVTHEHEACFRIQEMRLRSCIVSICIVGVNVTVRIPQQFFNRFHRSQTSGILKYFYAVFAVYFTFHEATETIFACILSPHNAECAFRPTRLLFSNHDQFGVIFILFQFVTHLY